jgi:Domain of unknown function (DUF4340)
MISEQNSRVAKVNANLTMVDVVRVLCLLLAVQISLAVILKLAETSYQLVEPSAPLLTCDFDKITKLVIEQNSNTTKAKSSMVLEKDKQVWKVPGYYSFPASVDKVNNIIDSLKGLKKGFPVSTNSSAAEHFNVGTNNFERSLSFYNGAEKINTLYLGSTPRFRTINARLANSNDIYAVPFSEYDLTTNPQDWIDRDITKLTPSEITCVDMGTFKVEKVSDKWNLVSSGKSKSLSDGVVQSFLGPIAHLSISSVIDPNKKIDLSSENQRLNYKVALKNGNIITYTFFKAKDKSSSYILKTSNNNWLFPIDDWVIDSVEKFTFASLEKSDSGTGKEHQSINMEQHPDKKIELH